MTEDLTPDQLDELKEAFKMFDKDGNGEVDKQELKEVLEELGQKPTDDEIDEMMREVDEDGNGVIDFKEFCELMRQKMDSVDKEQELMDAFKVFDLDGNGKIDSEELKAVMLRLGEDLGDDDIGEMIARADVDGDGEIDFDEFKKVMEDGGF